MSYHVVWVDHEHTKVLAPDGRVERHSHSLDSLDRDRRAERMFFETARTLGQSELILLVGPGITKFLFHSFLAEQFPRLFRRVAGCEPLDHATEPQIRAYGDKFFALKPLERGTT